MKTVASTLGVARSNLIERRDKVIQARGPYRKAEDAGLSDILCVGPVDHHAVTNRASNMMANCVFASDHSRGGIFQSAAT